MKYLPPPIFGALKTAVLAVFINVTAMLNAQNNNTCQTAVSANTDTICNLVTPYFINGHENKWLFFIADSGNYTFYFSETNIGNDADIKKITLYSDNCNNLTWLYSDSLGVNDSISSFTYNLVQGQSYYIQIQRYNINQEEFTSYCITKQIVPEQIFRNHTLLVCQNGSAQSFGSNLYGQLGLCNSQSPCHVNTVVGFPLGTFIKAVDNGGEFSMALTECGEVYIWGLVGGATVNCPQKIVECGAVAISAGERHGMILMLGGNVFCFGENIYGQLGNGSVGGQNWIPTLVTLPSAVTYIEAGGFFSTVILANGQVMSWGSNSYGELGKIVVGGAYGTPDYVVSLTNIIKIECGNEHAIALNNNNIVYTWGNNLFGQLGYTGPNTGTPLIPPGITSFNKTDITAGRFHSIIQTSASTYLAAGLNQFGQLHPTAFACGNITNIKTSFLPAFTLPALGGVTRIESGCSRNHNWAIYSNGSVRTWGMNDDFELGDCANGSSCFQGIFSDPLDANFNSAYPVGCQAIPNALPNIELSLTVSPNVTICKGNSATLSALGLSCSGGTYSWSPGGQTTPSITVTPNTTTAYTVTYTYCGISISKTIIVTVTEIFVQFDSNNSICLGQSVTLQPLVTGGTLNYNYIWNTTPPQFTSSITVSPTVTTTYTVTVIDAYGCIGTASVTVYVNPLPPAPVITGPNPSCDPSFTWCISNFNPNYTYSWSAPNAVSVTPTPNGQCADIIWNNAGGWITVTVTDLNGCTNTGTFYVNECCVKQSPEPGMTINLINQTASWLIANYPSFFSTLTPPTFDNTSAYLNINGTFTIDVPYLRIIQIPNIYLSENAEIIIGSGNHLELRQCTLQACSDKMWERIFIPNASSKLTAGGNLFMDAQHTVWSDNGGEMKLQSNTFKLNRICVQVEPYNQPIISTIENNQFIGNAPLKQPYTGLRTNIGINLIKVYNTNAIGGFIIGLNNTFTNMNIGINSVESIVHVFGNSFSNIQNTLSEAAIAAINISGRTNNFLFTPLPYMEIGGQGNKANTFTNCKNGVTARAATNMKISYNTFNSITTSGIYYQFFDNWQHISNVNIFKNNFQNNGTAIYSYRNFLCKSYIYSNTIQSNAPTGGIGIRAEEMGGSPNPNRTQIFANTIKGVTRGVWLTGTEQTKVDNNTIQVKKLNFFLARGIDASNCLKTEISANNIQCIPPTTASNAGGIYTSLSPASNICGNDIKNLGYAIQCNGPMVSRVVGNKFTNLPTGIWLNNGGIIGQQGAPGQPSNNRWMSNFTNHTLVTLGTPPASEIFHRSTPNYFVPVFNNGGTPPIIATITTGSQFGPVCPAIAPPPNLLLQVAKDQLTYSGPENRWHSRHNLYRELSLDTALLQSDTTFINFTDTISYENTGLLDSVKTIATNPALNNNLNLLQSASATNSTVSPLLNTEDRAKTVNSILLDMAFMSTTSLTPQQLSTLQAIAVECPYTEGTAVYDARVLVAPYDSTDYLNVCETEYNIENNGRFMQQENKQKNDVANEERIEIFPNPANDILNVVVETNSENDISISIYNLEGQLEIEEIYNNKKEIIQIDLSDLPMGMYIVKIRTDNVVVNKKIIINK